MKKINLLFALLLGLLIGTTACSDFLERSPEDRVSDDAVWKTPDHLKLYVNNFYSNGSLLPLRTGYDFSENPMYQDAAGGSDTQIPVNHSGRMNGESTVPESNGGWAYGDWAVLRNINYFFSRYKTAVGDENEINRYVGEALFFRAIFYFGKLRSFGDVPFYDEVLTLKDDVLLHKKRDPRNEVVQYLLDDLDLAVQYLPSRKDRAWDGRINKETAMLLQARIALYEGTWEKYHAGTPFGVTGSNGSGFITKAKEVTDALIALNSCDLDNAGTPNGYFNLFNQHSYAASKEVLFWRQYQTGVLTHTWPRYTYTGSAMGLTKRMIDSYLAGDGKPIEISSLPTSDATLIDVVTNRDPRLNQTIYVNDGLHVTDNQSTPNKVFTYPQLAGEGSTKCVTGYQMYKGHDLLEYESANGTAAQIYFRYAEALLINAEAKAELETITQTDLDKTINKLRDRTGMPHLVLADVNTWTYTKEFPALSNIINEIRRERKVELVGEGFRVDDIFRWAAAGILIRDYKPLGAVLAQWNGIDNALLGNISAISTEGGYINPYANTAVGVSGYKFDLNRDYLRPLPLTELVLSPELKPNNPGWE
ncbi:MAG: RagB/SusD family nutrient uptake outer membrane protein [Dysgonamonadaceae bacterium]|jgi:hypothetical protein|nr:RagB/SusD family nutrient uptake outer membrane protein [Dysgonamonadaceae bacterium]